MKRLVTARVQAFSQVTMVWQVGPPNLHLLRSSSQIKDLNSGTFGFVVLARDKQTGEIWAIKFIERGEKVRGATTPAAAASMLEV